MTPSFGTTLAAAVAALALGCGVDPAAQTLAEDGSDVADLAARVSSITASFALGAGPRYDLTALEATTTLYAPAGCVTTSTDGEALALSFHECSGPWGLVRVRGTVHVAPAGSDGFSIHASGLSLGLASVSFTATPTIGSRGSSRTLAWSLSLDGTTARGKTFTSEGSWKLTWSLGATCVRLSGAFQGDVGGATLSSQVSGLERCGGNCPSAGSMIVSSGPDLSDTLAFDGQDVVAYTTTGGTNDLLLACGL